jgi:NAD+ kinase
MKRFGVIYHPHNDAAVKQAEYVKEYLTNKGCSCWTASAWDSCEFEPRVKESDIVITAGGDGTVLRAAQITANYNVPIAGINHGTLGFLTEIPKDKVDEDLDRMLAGDYRLDERCILDVDVMQPNKELQSFHALNDVVIARGEMARLLGLNVVINGQKLTYLKSDGIVCSTPTGSTGYTYACGGSVMHPSSRNLQIVGIAPHLTFNHPIVLSADSVIEIEIFSGYTCTMNIDGHINLPIIDRTKFNVRMSKLTVRFVRFGEDNFFEKLTDKLRTRL